MANNVTKRSKMGKIMSIAAVSLCAALMLLGLQMILVARAGRACLASVRQLVPGVSTMADVRAIQQRFPASASGTCNADKCSVTFAFQSWASRMHLITPVGLQADVTIQKGTVASVDLMYSQEKSVLLALATGGEHFQQ